MNIAVIGSTRGIGLEFVKQLNQQHKVYAFCRSANSDLNSLNCEKVIENCDVTSLDSLKQARSEVSEVTFDWVLVVAGKLSSENLDDWSDERILQQFATNSLGAINAARIFSKQIGGKGKIGLLTSRMGSIEDNTSGGMYGYRMSKAALNAAGKSLAEDLKDRNITVLLLHPGYVKTDMTNHSGNITPEESVKGLIQIMQSKHIAQSGSFWHSNGEHLPW